VCGNNWDSLTAPAYSITKFRAKITLVNHKMRCLPAIHPLRHISSVCGLKTDLVLNQQFFKISITSYPNKLIHCNGDIKSAEYFNSHLHKIKPKVVLFAVGLTDQISKDDRRFDQQLTNDLEINLDSIKGFLRTAGNHCEVFTLALNLYRYTKKYLSPIQIE
jgi:hypothetical protein